MDSQGLPLLVFALILVVAAITYFLSIKAAQARTRAMQDLAQQVGFSFSAEGPSQRRSYEIEMALFQQGGSRKSKNIMVGRWNGLEVKVFDYSFVTGSGKSSHTWDQTIAAFTIKAGFPVFELRPEGIFDRIADAFVHKDIDFDSHLAFSRRYLLRGAIEKAVREMFSPALLTYCEELPADLKWHVEGCDDTLIFYQSDKSVDPEEIRNFLDTTSSMAKNFLSCSGLKTTSIS